MYHSNVSQQCPGPSAVDVQLRGAVVVTTPLAGFTFGAEGKLSVTHFLKKVFLFVGWLDPEERLALQCWGIMPAGVPSAKSGSVSAPGRSFA